jgi:hypothetical protein
VWDRQQALLLCSFGLCVAMVMLVFFIFLTAVLGVRCLQPQTPQFHLQSPQQVNHLLTVFTTHLSSTHLDFSMQHEKKMMEERENQLEQSKSAHSLHLFCSAYQNSPQLSNFLSTTLSMSSKEFHPIYHSQKNDLTCLLVMNEVFSQTTTLKNLPNEFIVTKIPHTIKLHHSTLLTSSVNEKLSIMNRPLTIEMAYGLGVGGKGTLTLTPKEYSVDFLHKAAKILSDESLLEQHWNAFYWTSETAKFHHQSSIPKEYSELASFTRLSSSSQQCNFNSLHIQTSRSHILYSTYASSPSAHHQRMNQNCLRFLMTVAAMQSEISFISVTYGESVDAISDRSNAPYEDAAPATDQNAWIQSGTSTETPYSDIGIDGTGYILGMIGTI